MQNLQTFTETTPMPATPAARRLLALAEVCEFFGGIHTSTLYRGMPHRFPLAVKVGPNLNRWIRSECEAGLQALIDQSRERRPISEPLHEALQRPRNRSKPAPSAGKKVSRETAPRAKKGARRDARR
jgi:predicted DNA-binding transcriptional regulator AlpA